MSKDQQAVVHIQNGNDVEPNEPGAVTELLFTPSPIVYDTNTAAIEHLKAKYTAIGPPSEPKEYKELTSAIADIRTRRTSVEKRRKELKRDALEYGRAIDKEAARLTELLIEIEEPLKTLKFDYDEQKRKEKEEAEAKERQRIGDIRNRLIESFGQQIAFNLQGKPAVMIRTKIALIEKIEVSEEIFNEFLEEAQQMKSDLLEGMKVMLEHQIEHQKKIEAEEAERKAEGERRKAEEEKRKEAEDKLAAERAEIERQKAEIEQLKQEMERMRKAAKPTPEPEPVAEPEPEPEPKEEDTQIPVYRKAPSPVTVTETVDSEEKPETEEQEQEREEPIDPITLAERDQLLKIGTERIPEFIESISFEVTNPELCAILVGALGVIKRAGELIVEDIEAFDESGKKESM